MVLGGGGLGLVDEEATAGEWARKTDHMGVGSRHGFPELADCLTRGVPRMELRSAPLPGPPCRTRDPYLLASTLRCRVGFKESGTKEIVSPDSLRNTSLDSNRK